MRPSPAPPQPHFPSPYARPSMLPILATQVETADHARIATFVYAPHDGVCPLPHDRHPPVLMLHGNGEEHGIFGPTIDVVTDAGHAVIAIDSRAQGKSTRGTEPLTYELMADDAMVALDALNIGRVHVLGFSDGGIEALLLARDHPDRVASITVLGANLTPEGVMTDPDWDIAGSIAANRAWATYLDRRGSAAHGKDPDLRNIDTSLLTPTAEEAAATADLLQLMLDEPHVDAKSLGAIACPATIMVGEFDCIADYETCSIVAAIPDARLVVVPGVGHSLPKHAPEAVTRELMATIGRAEMATYPALSK